MESIFVSLFREFGSIPVILCLLVVMWFIIRENKRESEHIKERFSSEMKNFKDNVQKEITDLRDKIESFKAQSDSKDQKLQECIHEIQARISEIEQNFVTRRDHYKDLGGWRTEIQDIRNMIMDVIRDKK